MASSPINFSEVAHHGRERVRARDGAEQVVRVLDVGDPVAQGFVDGVLQDLSPRVTSTTSAPSIRMRADVEGLTAGVDLAHVDAALEAEHGAHGGGGHAVLAGAGLGDHAGLAHALDEQGLAERVVDLVRAGVVQVLTLEEIWARDWFLFDKCGEARGFGQRVGGPRNAAGAS